MGDEIMDPNVSIDLRPEDERLPTEDNPRVQDDDDNFDLNQIRKGIPSVLRYRESKDIVDEEQKELEDVKKREKEFINQNYPNAEKNVLFRDYVKIREIEDDEGNIIFSAKFKTGVVWKFDPDGKIDPKAGKKLRKALGPHYSEILKENTENTDKIELEMKELNKVVKEHERSEELKKNKIKELENKVYELEIKEESYLVENEKFVNLQKQTEQELNNYNEEIIALKMEMRKGEKPTEIQEVQLDNLHTHISDKKKYLEYVKKEIKTEKEIFNELEAKIVENKRLLSEEKTLSTSERQIELDFIFEEKVKQIEDLTQELEVLKGEREELIVKLTLRQKIKQIFKEHGLTIFSITTSVGTIISAIVLNLTSGLTKIIKGVGSGVKALGNKIAQILPGIAGAIASFLFKTAGSVLGFLATNSWILILFGVTFAIEQFTKKK